MDFLDLLEREERIIFGQRIKRANFGAYVRLNRLGIQIDDLFSLMQPREAATLITSYFRIAGFDPEKRYRLRKLTGQQLKEAYRELLELNAIKGRFAFQEGGEPPGDPPPYDYPNRSVAWIVHKLSSRYGWTADYILNKLSPELVSALLQEILVAEFSEHEQVRALSEVAYQYDRAAKVSRFVPMPKPGWMAPKIEPKPVRIRKSMLPVGMVVRPDGAEIIH